MICFPNAKINLGLYVTALRTDGFHDIETLFYPIPLCDALEAVPLHSGDDHFTCTGITIDGKAADNLVMKALRLLRQHHDFPAMDIYLYKNIPFGAGLGGGSSDAAFFLKLINDLCRLHIDNRTLEQYAAQLGSDCPFFISNQPVIATGRGEIFEQIDLSLEGLFIALVKPDIFISTKEAYSGIEMHRSDRPLKEIAADPLDSWRQDMHNDFEKPIFIQHPAIGAIKQQLYDMGALYASMSGSGSSVYGLFREAPASLTDHFPRCYTFVSEFPRQ